MAELNERIRIARTLAGLSQDDVANFLDVQRSVVVRYEQERKPADSSLEKLAYLTGFPPEWFWEKPVTGILTFCPEKPGVEYSHPQIRMKETAINRDWPRFLEILGIDDLLTLKCNLGGIVVAYSDEVCAVVVGTHSVDTIRRVSSGLGIHIVQEICTDVDFLNCWMQPSYLYLKKVLEYGGKDLLRWSDPIEEGKPGTAVVDYRFEGSFRFGEDGVMNEDDIAARENAFLDRILNILKNDHFYFEQASVKRTSAIVKGAPAGWNFVYRDKE